MEIEKLVSEGLAQGRSYVKQVYYKVQHLIYSLLGGNETVNRKVTEQCYSEEHRIAQVRLSSKVP